MIKVIEDKQTTDWRQNWQMFVGRINDGIINDIISEVDKTEKAKTFNNADEELRSSRVSWITDKRVLNLLHDYVEIANRNAFNVHVYKSASLQYTEYHANENGHYDWHHDINWNENNGLDRKLSVTVQLSNSDEYEGGDFEFGECQSPPKESRQKGTVLVFPSYLRHKVSPVTRGVRKSLVAWFEGPVWR